MPGQTDQKVGSLAEEEAVALPVPINAAQRCRRGYFSPDVNHRPVRRLSVRARPYFFAFPLSPRDNETAGQFFFPDVGLSRCAIKAAVRGNANMVAVADGNVEKSKRRNGFPIGRPRHFPFPFCLPIALSRSHRFLDVSRSYLRLHTCASVCVCVCAASVVYIYIFTCTSTRRGSLSLFLSLSLLLSPVENENLAHSNPPHSKLVIRTYQAGTSFDFVIRAAGLRSHSPRGLSCAIVMPKQLPWLLLPHRRCVGNAISHA